jgi:hypothetical protein
MARKAGTSPDQDHLERTETDFLDLVNEAEREGQRGQISPDAVEGVVRAGRISGSTGR